MQEAALIHMLKVQDDIAIPTAARSCDNVLVKGKGDEDDDGDEVDGGAHGAHALGEEGPGGFAHVDAAEPRGDEARAEPADHGIRDGEGEGGKGERGDERLAIAVKGVCEDGERCAG